MTRKHCPVCLPFFPYPALQVWSQSCAEMQWEAAKTLAWGQLASGSSCKSCQAITSKTGGEAAFGYFTPGFQNVIFLLSGWTQAVPAGGCCCPSFDQGTEAQGCVELNAEDSGCHTVPKQCLALFWGARAESSHSQAFWIAASHRRAAGPVVVGGTRGEEESSLLGLELAASPQLWGKKVGDQGHMGHVKGTCTLRCGLYAMMTTTSKNSKLGVFVFLLLFFNPLNVPRRADKRTGTWKAGANSLSLAESLLLLFQLDLNPSWREQEAVLCCESSL